jgi:hypothetical protein
MLERTPVSGMAGGRGRSARAELRSCRSRARHIGGAACASVAPEGSRDGDPARRFRRGGGRTATRDRRAGHRSQMYGALSGASDNASLTPMPRGTTEILSLGLAVVSRGVILDSGGVLIRPVSGQWLPPPAFEAVLDARQVAFVRTTSAKAVDSVDRSGAENLDGRGRPRPTTTAAAEGSPDANITTIAVRTSVATAGPTWRCVEAGVDLGHGRSR